jgi:predicted membrane protein
MHLGHKAKQRLAIAMMIYVGLFFLGAFVFVVLDFKIGVFVVGGLVFWHANKWRKEEDIRQNFEQQIYEESRFKEMMREHEIEKKHEASQSN